MSRWIGTGVELGVRTRATWRVRDATTRRTRAREPRDDDASDEYNAVMNDESRQDDGETLAVDRGERGERFEVRLEGDARGVRSDEEDLGLGDVELEQLGAE